MVIMATILGITNWCLNFIAIVIFLIITITGIKYRRDLRDISLILTYNTCLAALLTCLSVCISTTSNLSTGFLTKNITFCYIWGLWYDIFECSIYHSYYLQAFYRLCRVVFYKKKSLVTHSLFIMLIIGQWSLTILILLPPIFLNWYVLLPTDQFCLVPYTSLGPELYHITIIYLIPLICISTVYIWITLFIRQTSRASSLVLTNNQRQRNLRDLTVIKRIVVLVSVLIVLRFPTIIFMIYAVSVGHLYPFTYSIVGLITSACMIFIGLMMINITPQLRNNVFIFILRDNRVHTQVSFPQRLTLPTATGGNNTAEHNRSLNIQRQTTSVQTHSPIKRESNLVYQSGSVESDGQCAHHKQI
jgi:hypothetical protein